MSIQVITAGGAGANVRLGIYENNSDTDNYPKTRKVDAGNLAVTSGGTKEVTGLGTVLNADTRYWAAIMCNDMNVTISGVSAGNLISWGAAIVSSLITPLTEITLGGVTYGVLPDPAGVTGASSEMSAFGSAPAIALGFSVV